MIKFFSFITLGISWLISLWASKSIFGILKDSTLHGWLSYHTLISMRAFEQWGFWQLLGVSLVASKSYEWEEYDIRNLWKDEGLYLSYPSLWLDIPYFIFKAIGWEVSISNLQIYSLVVNRFLCSIIIFFLYQEISKLVLKKLSDQPDIEKKSTIPALIGTVVWLLNPSVLYWTQNTYFADQAIILPFCSIILLATKSDFKLHNLVGWQRILLFLLSLVATGYDWYAWTFLLCLSSIYFWLNRDVGMAERIRALIPIFSGWLLVIISYLCQLLYFREGIPQILRTLQGRLFSNPYDTKLENFWLVYGNHLLDYMPSRQPVVVILLVICAIGSLYWVIKNCGSQNLLISLCLLLATPFLHNLLVASHTYGHNFSALKLSVGMILSYAVMPCLLLVTWLKKTRWQMLFMFIVLSSIMVFGVILSPTLFLSFSKYVAASNFSEQYGNLVKSEIAYNQVPFSENQLILAFAPNRLWYANRRVYDYKQVQNTIERFNLQNKPVEYVFIDQESHKAITEICDPSQKIKYKSVEFTFGVGTFAEKIVICKLNLPIKPDKN